jgi:hypothetical protein
MALPSEDDHLTPFSTDCVHFSVLIQNEGEIQEPTDTASGQDLYFEVLELQPIKLSLSFMRTERVSAEEK